MSGNIYVAYGGWGTTFRKYSTRTTQTPLLSDITINYQSYPSSASLISSAYDSTDAANILAKLEWTEVLASSTDVTFQLRTSSDGLAWSAWLGPDGTSGTSFTDPAGGEALPAALSDGTSDRYFQYRATLASDGVSAPILSGANLTYVVNGPPEISLADSPVQAGDGSITLDYQVADADTLTGRTPGSVYVRLEYCTANCTATGSETWAQASAISGQFATTTVTGASSTAYQLVWNPALDFPGQYLAEAKLRLSADDSEAANNLAYATSTAFVLDTRAPALGPVALAVDASANPALVTLSVTDDSPDLVMQLGSTADLAGVATSSYLSTTTLDLSSRPASVYARFTDRVGNLATTSVTLPETPTAMMIQDNSNLFSTPNEYRLFLAWKVPSAPAAGFSHYRIERSDDNVSFTSLASTSNRLINYYGDSAVVQDQLYYYRVSVVDLSGNVSYSSQVVSGKANGTQDAGEGGGGVGAAGVPPVISGVLATSTYSTQVTIEWETDLLSDSLVYYQASPGGDFSLAPTLGSATLRNNDSGYGRHAVTLSNLTPSTTYYYLVRSTAINEASASSTPGGDGYSFTTLPGPVIANDVQVSDITNSQALVSWSTDLSSASAVLYATSSELLNPVTVSTPELVTSHALVLSGLTPGTTYYFAVQSDTARRSNADGQGGYFSFKTTEDSEPPVISNVRCGHTADTTLSVLWTTNEPATGRTSYGTESDTYATTTDENTNLNLDHSFDLTNLLASTTYYFKVNSADINGYAATSSEYSCSTAGPLKTEEEVRNLVEQARAEGRTQGQSQAQGQGGGGTLIIDKTDKVAPRISDLAVSEIKHDSAQISWTTDEEAAAILRYGLDPSLKDSAGSEVFSTASRFGLSGLLASSTYYYKAAAIDRSGNIASSTMNSFSTPSLEEQLKAEGKSQAEIEKLEEQAQKEEEDKAQIFLEAAKRAVELVAKVASQVSLGTLETALKGQYQAIEELARSVPAPILGGQPSVITTASTAEIRWTTDKEANSLVALAPQQVYRVRAGQAEPYIRFDGQANERVKSHRILVSDLKPETTYHFQVRSKADLGPMAKSPDFTFTTRAETLEISTYAIQNLSANKARVKWLTSQETDTQLVYTPYRNGKLAVEERQVKSDDSLTTIHEIEVDDFEGGVLYQLELAGLDAKKVRISKIIDTFSTSKDDLPPEIVSVQTESALSQGKETKVQTIISWQTPEPTAGFVSYAKGVVAEGELLEKTPLETSYSKKHVAVITKFEPGTVYSFRVTAADSSGNETVSKTYTVLTPKQKESVFQLILKNFEDIFGWVGKVGR